MAKQNTGTNKPFTYKVYPFYRMLFDSCFEVFGDRNFLTEALIKKSNLFIPEEIEELPSSLHSARLFEWMCDNLNPLNDFNQILESERLVELKTITKDSSVLQIPKTNLQFRVLPKYRAYVNHVANIDDVKFSEAVELIIANFINSRTDFQYKLIKMSFVYRFEQNDIPRTQTR